MKKRDAPPPRVTPSAAGDYRRGVRPLTSRVTRVPPPMVSGTPRRGAPSETLPEGAYEFAVKGDELFNEGARVGQEAALRELRRGGLPIFDTLDLHRLTAAEAERALRRFCARARGAEARAVLIVHGKGTHSPGGYGVLRAEVAAWLATAPLAGDVLCFATARPKDGGSGALYVLLAPRKGAPGQGAGGTSSRGLGGGFAGGKRGSSGNAP